MTACSCDGDLCSGASCSTPDLIPVMSGSPLRRHNSLRAHNPTSNSPAPATAASRECITCRLFTCWAVCIQTIITRVVEESVESWQQRMEGFSLGDWCRVKKQWGYTVKNIHTSTDILWRFFHILTEPVQYMSVPVNRRNNGAQAHNGPWLCYSVDLWVQTYAEPVSL